MDISNPTSPVPVGFLPVIATQALVEVGSAYAYVIGGNTLSVVNVSVPASPVAIGTLTIGGSTLSEITRLGSTLFVVDWGNTVYLIDISNRANPTLLSTLTDGGVNFNPYYALARGSYLYVLDGFANMFVFDISNPAAPVQTHIEPLPSDGWDLALVGNTLLVADGMFGMHVYDVSAPANPVYISTYIATGNVRHVFAGQGLAYVFTLIGSVDVVDIANLASPQLLGSTGTFLTYPAQLVGCHFSALNIMSGLNVIVDASNPRNPAILPTTLPMASYPIAPYWTVSR
jgi:hypothetical protein